MDPLNTNAWITEGFTLSTRDFGSAASINNAGDVSGRIYVKPQLSTYQTSSGTFRINDPPLTIIRTWKADGTVETVATAGGRRDSESLAAVLQGKPSVASLLNFTDIDEAGHVVYTYTFQYDYQYSYYQLYDGPRDPNMPQINLLTDPSLPYGTFTRSQITSGRELKADPAELLNFVRTQYQPASQELKDIADEILHDYIHGLTEGAKSGLISGVTLVLNSVFTLLAPEASLALHIWELFDRGLSIFHGIETIQLLLQGSTLGDRLDQALQRWEQVNAEYARLADPVVPSKVLYQAGNKVDSPILLQAVAEPGIEIASKNMAFYAPFPSDQRLGTGLAVIGRNPGVGGDGRVVAFSGRGILNDGRQEDGIFLSVSDGQGGRRIIRIVSTLGGPNGTVFTGIDPKDRVAVTSVNEQGGVIVSFIATDSLGHRGLFVVRASGLDTGHVEVSRVLPVLRTGDTIDVLGQAETVSDLAVNDPLNDAGELAIWAATGSGKQLIVRAQPPKIESIAAGATGSDSASVEYGVSDQDLSHPFRIDLYESQDAVLSRQGDRLIGYLEVHADKVVSFDPSGQVLAIQTSQPLVAASTPGVALLLAPAAPNPNNFNQGDHKIEGRIAAPVTPGFHFLADCNQNPAEWVALSLRGNTTASSPTLTGLTYLKKLEKDGTIYADFGAVVVDPANSIGNRSASTYIILKNNFTDVSFRITSASISGDGFSLVHMDDADAEAFAIAHGIQLNGTSSYINPPGQTGGNLTTADSTNLEPVAGDAHDYAVLMVVFDPQPIPFAGPPQFSGELKITYEYTVGSETKAGVPQIIRLHGEGVYLQPDILTTPPLYVIIHGNEPDGKAWIDAMKAAIIRADPWFDGKGPQAIEQAFITSPYADDPDDARWSTDVSRAAPGFVQAAGESLAVEIMRRTIALGQTWPRIHMIGYGIGAVAINEAARTLEYYVNDSSKRIEQMTYLDPIDYATLARSQNYSAWQLPRIVVPSTVKWADVYYQQQASALASPFGNPIGVYANDPGRTAQQGANLNIDLSLVGGHGVVFTHDDVHKWYLGTINPDDTTWGSGTLSSDEKITDGERAYWYATELVKFNPSDGKSDHGYGGGLGVRWAWSLPGGAADSRLNGATRPTTSLGASTVRPMWAPTNSATNDDLSFFNGSFEYPLNANPQGPPPPTKLPAYGNDAWAGPWGAAATVGQVGGTQGNTLRYHETGSDTTLLHQVVFVRSNNPVFSLKFRPWLNDLVPPSALSLQIIVTVGSDTQTFTIPRDDFWVARNRWTQVAFDLSQMGGLATGRGDFASVTIELSGDLSSSAGYQYVEVDDMSFGFRPGDMIRTVSFLDVRESSGNTGPEITDSDYAGTGKKTLTGMIGTLVEGPQYVGGQAWWRVDFGPGAYSGYVSEKDLKEVVPPYVRGIDIDDGRPIDDARMLAASGTQFVIIQATEGYNLDDPLLGLNVTNSRSQGLLTGVYHFAYPGSESLNAFGDQDAINEADYFWSIAGSYIRDGYMRPFLDMENTPDNQAYKLTDLVRSNAQSPVLSNRNDPTSVIAEVAAGVVGSLRDESAGWLFVDFGTASGWIQAANVSRDASTLKNIVSNWVRAWTARVEALSGVRPIIYTTLSFAETYLEPDIADYPLWIANYADKTLDDNQNYVPNLTSNTLASKPWEPWEFWQYTIQENLTFPDDGLFVSGITSLSNLNGSRVDGDVFNGTIFEPLRCFKCVKHEALGG